MGRLTCLSILHISITITLLQLLGPEIVQKLIKGFHDLQRLHKASRPILSPRDH